MNIEIANKINNINKTMEVWGNYLHSGGIDLSHGAYMSTLMDLVLELYNSSNEMVISSTQLKATRDTLANQRGHTKDGKAIVKVLDELIGQCPDCGYPANGHSKKSPAKRS